MSPRLTPLARSYLYVPGHRSDLLDKARGSGTDAIVIDLEDAVPQQEKARARSTVAEAVTQGGEQQLWVRINAVAAGHVEEDIAAAVAGPHLAGIRIAKVESVDDVRSVGFQLTLKGSHAAIHCVVESALGLERISELVRADPAVTGVALGEADLAADLGADADDALSYARGRCVAAARAAGLAPPVQSVFVGIDDDAGLRRSSETGRGLGFFGRSAIHPRQLAIINAVYTPSAARIKQARELVEALERSSAEGSSAFTLPDGRFVDPAVVAAARRTLELASRLVGAVEEPG